MQTVTHKVPGGKLVRVKARVEDGKMQAPQISGDFFLMPPEKIKALEEALDQFPTDKADELADVLSYVAERENIRMQGVTPRAIADAAARLGEDEQ